VIDFDDFDEDLDEENGGSVTFEMQIVAVTKGMRYFYLPLNLTILS
jgi:hypothetical protein